MNAKDPQKEFVDALLADGSSSEKGFSKQSYNFKQTDACLRKHLELSGRNVRCYWSGNDLSRARRQFQQQQQARGDYALLVLVCHPDYCEQAQEWARGGEFMVDSIIVVECSSAPSEPEHIRLICVVEQPGASAQMGIDRMFPGLETRTRGSVAQPTLIRDLSSENYGSSCDWVEIKVGEDGGTGWEFGTCLWSPSRDVSDRDRYAVMREPRQGDRVFHVRDGEFVGQSRVAAETTRSDDQPPRVGNWADMPPYYRIELTDYEPFPRRFAIFEFLKHEDRPIRAELSVSPKHFPFCVQGGRLRTVQGLYLAKSTAALTQLILKHAELVQEEGPDDLFMSQSEFGKIVELLRRKRNLILQGPPGVGKTFVAKRVAEAIAGKSANDRIEMVQFHPSYSYEDFIQGYRPSVDGFELRDGVFFRFCQEARSQADTPFVFVIDEINRGDLAKIFGELLLLIERDKRGEDFALPLTYSGTSSTAFFVPENIHLLGLMNTADRSLALVDYALRRRFVFYDLKPQFGSETFRRFLTRHGAADDLVDRIISSMTQLNSDLAADSRNFGPGWEIGHSFFCPQDGQVADKVWLDDVLTYEIEPLLREYFVDDPDEAVERLRDLREHA